MSLEAHDEDPLLLGLADLLTKNVAGELQRHAGPVGELVLPRPGLLVDGKRRLTRLLGSGSFGAVYEARHIDLDRLEAIKFLHERWVIGGEHDVCARFLEEARVMAKLRGRHLVEVYDWGTLPGGVPFFVMERLEGKTLRDRLREMGELALVEVFEVATQVLAGLCEVHAHSVVHRDVKPENIFLTHAGVKLLDFGLAKTSVSWTASDAVMGTPLYMAPELVTGLCKPDARTDLYAVSAVMYEMLAGAAPFRRPGMGRRELERVVVRELPVSLRACCRGIPAGLDELILAGLAKRQEGRPRTAREMLDRLLEIHERWREPASFEEDDGVTVEDAPMPEARVAQMQSGGLEGRGVGKVRWGRRWAAALGLLGSLGLAGAAWPLWPDLRAGAGGVLVTRPQWASDEVERTHREVCHALGGERSRASDAVVELPVQCVTLSRLDASPARLDAVGNAAGAKLVIHVDDGWIRVSTLARGRGIPLLADLPGLELPARAGAEASLAAVLRGVLATDSEAVGPLPVLDPERDGFHMAVLAELLRRYHGQERDGAGERLERLVGHCDAQAAGAGPSQVYCDRARLLQALDMPSCERSIVPLRGLLAAVQAGGRPDREVKIELARCLAEGEGGSAEVEEAERLVAEVLAEGAQEPCTGVSVMSTVARIEARGGDRSGELGRAAAQGNAGVEACGERTLVARERLVRAYVLATEEPARWCEAAVDAAGAHALAPRSVEAATLWAEAWMQCSGAKHGDRKAVLEALAAERFEPGRERVSVAFTRWAVTRESADADAVLRAYDGVAAGVVPLIEGTMSSLREGLCEERERPCAYELLGRGKQVEDRLALVRSLGLDRR